MYRNAPHERERGGAFKRARPPPSRRAESNLLALRGDHLPAGLGQQGTFHRVGPNRATWPSFWTANPYQEV
jgi:hypothetical protein